MNNAILFYPAPQDHHNRIRMYAINLRRKTEAFQTNALTLRSPGVTMVRLPCNIHRTHPSEKTTLCSAASDKKTNLTAFETRSLATAVQSTCGRSKSNSSSTSNTSSSDNSNKYMLL